jgi:hypothetical protein
MLDKEMNGSCLIYTLELQWAFSGSRLFERLPPIARNGINVELISMEVNDVNTNSCSG